MPRLLLFSRPDCPLCDEAEALALSLGIDFEYRDISNDLELLGRYRDRIPVFRDPDSGEEVGAPIEPAALRALAQS